MAGVVGVAGKLTVTSDLGAGVSADVLSPEDSKSTKVGSSTIRDVGFWHLGDNVEPVGVWASAILLLRWRGRAAGGWCHV